MKKGVFHTLFHYGQKKRSGMKLSVKGVIYRAGSIHSIDTGDLGTGAGLG